MLHNIFNLALLIQDAATDASEDPPSMIFPLVAMGAIFYFLLIAPERKQRKQRQAMLNELTKGAEVMTTGGIIGKVIEVRDERVVVQVADSTRLTFSRQAVQTVIDADEGKDEKKPAVEERSKKD